MLPLSLLFSSDEQASRALSQALTELEFAVECCPEIFGAVEKITSRAFDIIVSDWNEGLEAAFLLKTSRELKANHAAFTVAIADPDSAEAAHEAGADLVINRPVVSDEVKYALLTCDPFLAHMKMWLPKLGVPAPEPVAEQEAGGNDGQETSAANPYAVHIPVPKPVSVVAETPRSLRAWPSPPPPRRPQSPSALVAAESIFEENRLFQTRAQTAMLREPSFSSAGNPIRRRETGRLLPSIAIAVAFLSVGYVFSEPLYSHGTSTSVAQMWGRALGRTHEWLHGSNETESASAVQVAEDGSSDPVRSRRSVSRIRVTPARDPYQTFPSAAVQQPAQVQPMQVESQAVNEAQPAAAVAVRIPESLRAPVQNATMRNVAARITPSLLAALEPVALSEDLSRKLLLQQVLPSYPEKAIRARLQGAVVLQAFIARDGTIQDLKLIRGSFLLGQAAYRAVKQWRYQPYLLNGKAVEAETLVTVDFKLP
jgi:TonB family protein